MKKMIMFQKCLVFFILSFQVSVLAASKKKITLALNWKAEPQFGGFYAALNNNHFKNAQLNIEILEGGSGTPTVQMLANSQVDYAIVSAEEILISNERNPSNPLKAIFAVYQVNPQMIMCHEMRNFTSLSEVYSNPGKLSIQSGLSYAQFLKNKMKQNKVANRVTTVPYTGGISYFLNDTHLCQQGFATSEPLLADKAGKKTKVFLIAEEGFNPYTTVLAVRKTDFDKNKIEISKLVAAVKSGWNDYVSNPGPTNLIMNKLNKAMDMDTFAASAKAQLSLIVRPGFGLGQMTEERWQQLIQQMLDLKLITKTQKPKDLFENF